VARTRKIMMKNYLISIIGFLLFLTLFSCAPIVKTDIKSLKENPKEYKGKWVIVTTNIKSLLEVPVDYFYKKIEITGYVKLHGFGGIGDWNFLLQDKEGRSLECYEHEYELRSWIMPEVVLKRAEKENGKVTVEGEFKRSGRIELDWIEYQGQRYSTDYVPPLVRLP
jgi:hypothetical protein